MSINKMPKLIPMNSQKKNHNHVMYYAYMYVMLTSKFGKIGMFQLAAYPCSKSAFICITWLYTHNAQWWQTGRVLKHFH
jgi:hypothetical protein